MRLNSLCHRHLSSLSVHFSSLSHIPSIYLVFPTGQSFFFSVPQASHLSSLSHRPVICLLRSTGHSFVFSSLSHRPFICLLCPTGPSFVFSVPQAIHLSSLSHRPFIYLLCPTGHSFIFSVPQAIHLSSLLCPAGHSFVFVSQAIHLFSRHSVVFCSLSHRPFICLLCPTGHSFVFSVPQAIHLFSLSHRPLICLLCPTELKPGQSCAGRYKDQCAPEAECTDEFICSKLSKWTKQNRRAMIYLSMTFHPDFDCLLLFTLILFDDWRECVMYVLGTTECR